MVTQVDKVPTRDQQQDEGQTTPEDTVNEGIVADEDFWRDERKLIGKKARVSESRAKGDSKVNEVELSRVNRESGSCENFEKNWLNEERAKSQSIAVRRESNNDASLMECSEVENENEEDEGNIYESYLRTYSELEGDEEENEDTDEEIDNANGWVRKKVVTTQVQQQDARAIDDNDHGVQQVMPNLNKTAIGEVNVVNSRHVNFGDRNFYKGPVTIKQFVYTNACPIQDKNNDPINNNINEAYNGRKSDGELDQVPRVKGDQTILHPYGDYDTGDRFFFSNDSPKKNSIFSDGNEKEQKLFDKQKGLFFHFSNLSIKSSRIATQSRVRLRYGFYVKKLDRKKILEKKVSKTIESLPTF